MDTFSRDIGPSYVPAFAARLLLAIGRGIARTPETIRRALIEEDAEGWWTLAVVVVLWYADALPPAEARTVAETLQPVPLAPLAQNLTLFRERLVPFVRTAHQARSEAQLAAAGVYFVAAVEQLGLQMLSAAMKAAPLEAVQEQVLDRVPLPVEVKLDYYRIVGVQPRGVTSLPSSAVRTSSSPSRAERFDREDFGARGSPSSSARTAASKRTPLQPPAPQLAAEDVTRAYLHTLGWDATQVERWLVGPRETKRT
jgi:hypothetical protein